MEATETIERRKITWSRWDARRRKTVTSHPTVWIWTDAEGTERVFDTKAEAVAAKAMQDGES